MKTLILTEKPSIARDFARALGVKGKREGYLEGGDHVIVWAIGHLVELADPQDYAAKWKRWSLNTLPILPQQLKYKPIANVRKQLKVVQQQLQRSDIGRIIIATDAGREGEVIARTILQTVGQVSSELVRFWTSQALTPQVITETLESVRPAAEYDRLWHAGQARQAADWLVGMNLTRAATLRMGNYPNVFSIGRVQTAVLALLVDRQMERENFKSEPYWLLGANFFNPAKGTWRGTWFNKEANRFTSKHEADRIIALLQGQTGSVKSVKRGKKKQPPQLLYSLTDLQRDANSKYAFSAKQALDIAQKLYEQRKCLSYPRTDSRVLGSKNVSLAAKLIGKLSSVYPELFAGINEKLIVASNKRVFNDAKLTDHHALIPLAPLPEQAGRSERLVYHLVLRRFAAAFHPDYEYEATTIITEVEGETFRTQGSRPVVLGWKTVYGKAEKAEEHTGNDGEEPEVQDLPLLEKGDTAQVKDARLEEKMTQPPPAYTEALLLKDMTNPARYVSEDELKKIFKGEIGLGTQATRAQIIETLLARHYVVREKKLLSPTAKGRLLIDRLRLLSSAKAIATPEETARWEMELERIAQGMGNSEAFMDAIRKFVIKGVEEFKMNEMQQQIEEPLGKCPACGGNVIEGKKGFGCANWRQQDGACRFVVWKKIAGQTITPDHVRMLLAGESIPAMEFISKEGRRFSAGLKLEQEGEDGRWTTRFALGDQDAAPSDSIPAEPSRAKQSLGTCPLCGGAIVEGRKGFGCANWRSQDGGCRFVIWKEIAGKRLSPDDVVMLLETGETGVISGFKSRKGKDFSARLKLEGEGYKTVFVFS